MNSISSILPLDNVVAQLDASSKKRVFEQVGILFENHHHIGRSLIYDALFAREKLGSTALGQGIAIPHGRIKGLKAPLGAFVRLGVPVQFDAPDGQPVNLIFVLLVPEAANEQHLHLLSELAQLFSDRALREQLATAPDAATLHRLFTQWNAN
jgi:PTS system nitrogen regulatory IIA component